MHRISVIKDFISAEDANVLIQEQRSPSEINTYPDYYANRVGGTAFPYNKTVMSILKKYSIKANETIKDLYGFINPIYTYKAFGGTWSEGSSGGLHADGGDKEPFVEWSTVIYLNDSSEWTGGSIYFPNQGFEYQPEGLSAIMFPSCGYEHIHGIKEITSGVRRTAAFMHVSHPNYADPELLPEGVDLSKVDWVGDVV